jgi:DedD protein
LSSALQNRLVGTIIIVAVAVIFLPNLLDGKKESKENLFVTLPAKPAMNTVKPPKDLDKSKVREAASRKVEVISEQAMDDKPEQIAVETVIANSQPENQQIEDVKDVAVVTPETDPSSSDRIKVGSLQQQTVIEQDSDKLLASVGWVVQLGVFRHEKNVQELLGLLDKAGYRAFSRQAMTSSGSLTKVFVGPDLQKNNLENSLPHLKELTKVQGRVTPFFSSIITSAKK